MRYEQNLKEMLVSDVVEYKDVMDFLTETKIIEDKNHLRLFNTFIRVANTNGYKEAIQYAIEKEKELANGNTYVYLQDNMLNEEELVIFQAGIPYLVNNKEIKNEDGIKVALDNIWVEFKTSVE